MNIVLQVGQCGNQLGSQFLRTVADFVGQTKSYGNIFDETKQRFFSETEDDCKLSARAVLVDTEPKVIAETLKSVEQQQFCYRSTYAEKQGAANNWAMGFFHHGTLAREQVLDLIRKEVEKCDYLDGFLFFMSVAGGTGSGLGSYLTEMLKDEFASVPVMNQVVWPFCRGEVTVQAYNAVLSLAHLQSSSDATVIYENDQLYKLCTQRLGLKDVSLSDINVIASSQLASLLLPSKSSTSEFTPLFGDILSHLVAHPQFKLLNIRSVPQEPPKCRPYSTYTWQTLLRILRRMVLYSSIVEEWTSKNEDVTASCRSVANLLLARGVDAETVHAEMLCKPSLPYPSWVPDGAKVKVWHHPTPVFGQQKSATLVNNGQSVIPCIDVNVARAWKMYNYKVYLHHYEQHGFQEDDFLECFKQVEQVVTSYKALSVM